MRDRGFSGMRLDSVGFGTASVCSIRSAKRLSKGTPVAIPLGGWPATRPRWSAESELVSRDVQRAVKDAEDIYIAVILDQVSNTIVAMQQKPDVAR